MVKAKAVCTRKLVKDTLLFWIIMDKEQTEMRKKEDKVAVEALKHEHLREAKRLVLSRTCKMSGNYFGRSIPFMTIMQF